MENIDDQGRKRYAGASSLAPHASTHQASGSDQIKLDDLAAPDDNTDRDATSALHGLMPKADKVKLDGIALGSAYAQDYQSTNSLTDVDMNSMSVTVTVPAVTSKVLLIFTTAANNNTAGKKTFLVIDRAGTDVGYIDTGGGHAANERVPTTLILVDTGVSGSVTYHVEWHVDGGTSDVYSRAFVVVVIP